MGWIIVVILLIGVTALLSYKAASKEHATQNGRVETSGNGSFDFDIVGESHYQKNLEAIVGGKTGESVEHPCKATFVLEDANPYDPQAVRVDIENKQVGYLSRQQARVYRRKLNQGSPTVFDALIVGGWKRGSDEGHFGVKIDL